MMKTFEQVLKLLSENAKGFGDTAVPLNDAMGRMLAQDVYADRDFPPYDRSAMDGIVVRMNDLDSGMRTFRIDGEQLAGSPIIEMDPSMECMEIMTGAPVPNGANVVIRYEDLEIKDGLAQVKIDQFAQWRNIHRRGSDAPKGSKLIDAGKVVNAGDISILATIGHAFVSVRNLPKVALISTGDELVGLNQHPAPHQIRKSNVPTLGALLTRDHVEYETFHFNDDEFLMKSEIGKLTDSFDVIILCGGVSKGKRDYVPRVLEFSGIKPVFHGVAQRPGKPFWFGINDKTTVFGFPGNPISTIVCYTMYFRKWLADSIKVATHHPHHPRLARLGKDFNFKPTLTYHLLVSLKYEGTELFADPIIGNGSGDLTALSTADALMTLPQDVEFFKENEVYPITLL